MGRGGAEREAGKYRSSTEKERRDEGGRGATEENGDGKVGCSARAKGRRRKESRTEK